MSGSEIEIGPITRCIADQIQKRRERFGMSYAFMSRQLAERGRPIPPLGLRRIEAYERRMDLDDLIAIATVLDIDAMDLIAHATGRRSCTGGETLVL